MNNGGMTHFAMISMSWQHVVSKYPQNKYTRLLLQVKAQGQLFLSFSNDKCFSLASGRVGAS
jgi:hypothetical protein